MKCKLELRDNCPFVEYIKSFEDHYRACSLCLKALYALARLESNRRIVVVNTL